MARRNMPPRNLAFPCEPAYAFCRGCAPPKFRPTRIGRRRLPDRRGVRAGDLRKDQVRHNETRRWVKWTTRFTKATTGGLEKTGQKHTLPKPTSGRPWFSPET